MKVGRHFFFLLSSILLFQLIIFPSFVEARLCSSGGECVPVALFDWITFKIEAVSTKECGDDACAMFWCLVDGKKAMVGYGCYSDYVSYCGDVSNNAKVDLTNNKITDGVGAEGPNAKVYACKPADELPRCAQDEYSVLVNKGRDFFPRDKPFMKGADLNVEERTCEYVQRSGAVNQMDSFKLFGSIFIGLMLAQFW